MRFLPSVATDTVGYVTDDGLSGGFDLPILGHTIDKDVISENGDRSTASTSQQNQWVLGSTYVSTPLSMLTILSRYNVFFLKQL